MNRIFISHLIPSIFILKFNQSQAGYNFSCNLINGSCFDMVFSIPPSNVFGRLYEKFSTERVNIIFFRKLRMYRYTILLSLLLENIYLLLKLKKKSNIWFYNITILNIISYIFCLLYIKSIKVYVIVLDFTPPKRFFSFQKFYLYLINKADGIITLSESELFTCKNRACLAGVVPDSNIKYPVIEQLNKNFLLSGVINERIALISVVLEVFAALPNMNLYISGNIENPDLINKYVKNYSNIKLLGHLNYEEYLKVLEKCTYCLSTRNPDFPENINNFPSKIIEHLLYNRVIISTIEYKQINSFRYFTIPYEIEDMKEAILGIGSLGKDKLKDYMNQSSLVYEKFNPSAWSKLMDTIENKK